ncbi:MAG: HPr family phosphocarrier protein [Spirochaetales bacterium]|jgi:phosphocarrier protein|nr:HPr family phosphocarrier protein [Spirochaetales bacterium]
MIEKAVTVKNRAGIHARPAANIVKTANKFNCEIRIKKDNDEINAKSIMGIITLAAAFKTELILVADGEDEQSAVDALFNLFENKFEEE